MTKQPTPYQTGQRLADEGWGLSDVWGAVNCDSEVEEALKGYMDQIKHYEKLESEHLGDFDKQTGIYNKEHERKLFENWARTFHVGKNRFARYTAGEYRDEAVYDSWQVWQARAQLSYKKDTP